MSIIGCDLHSRYQVVAGVNTEDGEVVTRRLEHENGEAKAFYAGLAKPSLIGIEATGYTQWVERMLAGMGHELWMGDPAEIWARSVRRQVTDTRAAEHLLDLLLTKRFPRVWVPRPEERDLRQLLKHRDKLVRIANVGEKPTPLPGDEPGNLPPAQTVEYPRASRVGRVELGPVGEPAAEGVAGAAGQSGASHRATRPSGEDGGGAAPGGGAVDGTEGRGAGDGFGLRADDRCGGAFSQQPQAGQLSGTEPQRAFQRRPSTAGPHQQAGERNAALAAGGGRPERGAVRCPTAAQVSTFEVPTGREGGQSGPGSSPGGASVLGAAPSELRDAAGSHAR